MFVERFFCLFGGRGFYVGVKMKVYNVCVFGKIFYSRNSLVFFYYTIDVS